MSDHPVDFLDALDSVRWFLEETLPNIGHDTLVLGNLGWDTN
jgi:hypothetical protein